MKILVLSQLVPFPLDSGAKVRLYYTLRHLSLQHDVRLLAFSRPSDQPAFMNQLRTICQDVKAVPIERAKLFDLSCLLTNVLARRSFLLARNLQEPMFRALEREVRESGPFDAVHADQIWMAPYALRAAELQEGRTLTVLDRHNALFRILRSFRGSTRNPLLKTWLGLEEGWLRREEDQLMRRFDRIVWVNEADLRSFREEVSTRQPGGEQAVHQVIPISIERHELTQSDAERFRVTFVGGLHWPPNREAVEWFVRRVWPGVFREHPAAVFSVIGAQPGKLSGRIRRVSGVEILGYQPRLDEILAETAVLVVPLQSGSGTRVKILDAWSHGLPVVSTTMGAEGLEATSGANILVADGAPGFADAVCLTLKDRSMSRRLGRSGRETVVSLYDWRRNYVAWDDVYHEDFVPDGLSAEPDPGPPIRTASSSE